MSKWQWDQMFSTALINNPFEADEETMAMAECNAVKPKQKGTKEGQLETTRGKMYIQIGYRSVQTDCSQDWFYHTGFAIKGEAKPADWYKDDAYYQIISPAIKGLIILTDDSYLDYNEKELFEIQNLKLGYISCYQTLLSHDGYDAPVFEKALTNEYAGRAYQELTAEISKIHFMRSGKVESVSPEFELLSLGLGTAVKKISITFASKVSVKALTPKAFYLAAREALGKTKVGDFLDKTLIAELRATGAKFTEIDLFWIFKNKEGKIIFLEKGNSSAGLEHILTHKTEFITKGVKETDIPDFIMHALKENKIIGSSFVN